MGTRAAAVGLIAAAAAAACPPAVAQAPSAPNSVKIEVHDFMFGPRTLTVAAGSTVVWTNLDQEPHTIASDQGLFRSGAIDTNETFAFKFDRPGTYRYFCTIHPQMLGTIVVQ